MSDAPIATSVAESFPHRCSGCGLRWHATTAGSVAAELCGDCWRKVQPILHREPMSEAPVTPAAQALDALEFAYGAVLDAIGLEDGLDGAAGHAVLKMVRAALVANGRTPPTYPAEDEVVTPVPFLSAEAPVTPAVSPRAWHCPDCWHINEWTAIECARCRVISPPNKEYWEVKRAALSTPAPRPETELQGPAGGARTDALAKLVQSTGPFSTWDDPIWKLLNEADDEKSKWYAQQWACWFVKLVDAASALSNRLTTLDEEAAGAAPRRAAAPPPQNDHESRSPDGDGPDILSRGQRDVVRSASGPPRPKFSRVAEGGESDTGAGSEPADSQPFSDRGGARGSRDGWQPIETAPKDGKPILLWWPQECLRPVVGLWHERAGSEKPGHWFSDVTDCDVDDSLPTHWMDLPAAPGAETP